ncbi:hypothetical protein EDB80DRAFT_772231 [Ilyonectria destructans]|nr:hypothetical protein EDB80DRAFT_772231 [Ilyonectria destructans]
MASAENGDLKIRELCTDKAWWRVPHLIKLNILLLVPFLTSYVGGFDGSMLNGIQTVPKWQEYEFQKFLRRARVVLFYFDRPSGSLLGLMVNMQVIGGVVSLPLAPWAADKYGRRHPIFLGALVQGCAKGFGMFIAGRFFVGLGGGFVAAAAPPLLGELAYPTHRPITPPSTTLHGTWGPSLLLGPPLAPSGWQITGAGGSPHFCKPSSLFNRIARRDNTALSFVVSQVGKATKPSLSRDGKVRPWWYKMSRILAQKKSPKDRARVKLFSYLPHQDQTLFNTEVG